MKILVAGVGNIFFSDDAFGVEVARRLAQEELPDGVEVGDYGIRGVHLAYQLLDGYDTAILVDATPRGGEPGTVYVIEPDLDAEDDESLAAAGIADAHGMDPASVLAYLKSLGGEVGRVLVVGCEPSDTGEGIGLSEPVVAAVDEAVQVVTELVAEVRETHREETRA